MSLVRSLIVTVLLLTLSGSAVTASPWDSDGDGLRDSFEKGTGVTSASDPDTDDDGVVDAAEDNDRDRVSNRAEQRYGTDPLLRDSDLDGIPDGREDSDRDGRSDAVEQDHRPIPAGLRPRLIGAPGDVSPYKAGCQATHGMSRVVTCSYGPADSATRVVLMGDSHAMQLATPIVTVARANGWRLTTLVKKACPPVLGIHNRAQRWLDDGGSCRQWRRDALDWLATNPPDHIILAHSDDYAISTLKGKRISGDKRAAVWREGMKRTLSRMPDRSRVLVLGDIPYNRINPVNCLKKHPNNIAKCVTSRQPLHKRKIELAIEQAARAKDADFRRFYDKVCSYDPCPIIQGNVLMWRDRGHLTATFTRKLTPTFRSMLGKVVRSARPAGGRG